MIYIENTLKKINHPSNRRIGNVNLVSIENQQRHGESFTYKIMRENYKLLRYVLFIMSCSLCLVHYVKKSIVTYLYINLWSEILTFFIFIVNNED